MLVNARRVTPGTAIRATVCVVGAGPLGIAVTSSLADRGLDVVLVESGSTADDPDADALGDVAAIQFGGVRALNNTRRFGGNANAWQVRTGRTARGVRVAPLTAADLEGHSAPGSAWPYSLDTLQPYLDRAQDFFGLPRAGYDAAEWIEPHQMEQLIVDPDVRSAVFQFPDGGALVGRSLRRLRDRPGVRVLTRATVVEVLTDERATRAIGVRVATAPNREFRVEADRVVLAAGTASTTQLLLASDAVRPAGLGNSSDLLGRHFMDHLLLHGGVLHPRLRADIDHRDLYDLRTVRGVPVLGHLQLSDERLRRADLLNLSLILLPRGPRVREADSPRRAAGVRAALAVRENLIRRQLPSARVLGDLLRGLDGAALRQVRAITAPEASLGRGGWTKRSDPARRFNHFAVVHQAEQAPHPDNRLTLSDDRDRLGLRKIVVDWRWHDDDIARTVRAQQVFANALRRAGWGEFQIASRDGRPVVHSHSSNHFMGTTRMHASPHHGVVDPRGAVHGTPNLYVASSSLFPSGGFANVTLTAVAVALRVADSVVEDCQALTVGARVPPRPTRRRARSEEST